MKKGSLLALLPILVFLLVFIGSGIVFHDFYAMPAAVGFLIALVVAFFQNPKRTFAQKLDGASTISAPFLLINREKGVTNIGVEASVSGGEIAVARYGAFASALVLE